MNISLQDQAHVRDLIRLAVFNHCLHDSWMDVCPYDYGTGSGDYGTGNGDYTAAGR